MCSRIITQTALTLCLSPTAMTVRRVSGEKRNDPDLKHPICFLVQGLLHLVPADRDLHHPQHRDGHLLLHRHQLPEEGHQQHGHHDKQVENFTPFSPHFFVLISKYTCLKENS